MKVSTRNEERYVVVIYKCCDIVTPMCHMYQLLACHNVK